MKSIKTLSILLLFVSIIAIKLNGMDLCPDQMNLCPDKPQEHLPFDFSATLKQADQCRTYGHPDDAKSLYNQIIEKYPHVPLEIYIPALLGLACVYKIEGNEIIALQFFHSVAGHISTLPKQPKPTSIPLHRIIIQIFFSAHLNLAEYYFATGRHEYLGIAWHHYNKIITLPAVQLTHPQLYRHCLEQKNRISLLIKTPATLSQGYRSVMPLKDQTIVHGKRPAAIGESASPDSKRERTS